MGERNVSGFEALRLKRFKFRRSSLGAAARRIPSEGGFRDVRLCSVLFGAQEHDARVTPGAITRTRRGTVFTLAPPIREKTNRHGVPSGRVAGEELRRGLPRACPRHQRRCREGSEIPLRRGTFCRLGRVGYAQLMTSTFVDQLIVGLGGAVAGALATFGLTIRLQRSDRLLDAYATYAGAVEERN